ncbi:MAG: patatin-like phospholipase family protein, partial [Hydrogenophilales bacterium]|nr:patatin-like phospholipase family protein [Hydrogenophilales bacterium]
GSREFADMDIPFACVAADIETGEEVVLRSGRVAEAIRASCGLPIIFVPTQINGRYLVDGGLVNPVPVSLCRAMGADLVIAVDLNADLLGRHLKPRPAKATSAHKPAEPETLTDTVMARIQMGMAQLGINHGDAPRPPAMLDVLASSINIMQVLITRSRLAGEPADVMITPLLADLDLMDFHRGSVAIDAGRQAVEFVLPALRARLNGANGA